MTRLYDIAHRTEFLYSQPVTISHHLAHFNPRPVAHQICHRWSRAITPAPGVQTESLDYFGNPTSHFTVQDQHQKLTVQAGGRIAVTAPSYAPLEESPPWEESPALLFSRQGKDHLGLAEFVFDSPMAAGSRAVHDYALSCFSPGQPVLVAARQLVTKIFEDFQFDGSATTVTTSVDEAFSLRRGVCQDFAHIALSALRSLGIPARYVSGYLLTHPPEGQERLTGADASHAWISVWSPSHGWVDMDPTNDLIPQNEHITIAWGRDYGDVSPLGGVILGGGQHEVSVSVDVRPVTGEAKPIAKGKVMAASL